MTGIILAWDKKGRNPNIDRPLLRSLAPYVDCIKIGPVSIYAPERMETALEIARDALYFGFQVFWDLKLHDIGNTDLEALEDVANLPGISMLTIHAASSRKCLQDVASFCAQRKILALAVTLTDIEPDDCKTLHGDLPPETVLRHANYAFQNGIRGVVCSPQELVLLRPLGDMKKVTPGVRPVWALANDQKRIGTPAQAARDGADYIVVGGPILNPPAGMTPAEAAHDIRAEMEAALAA